MDSHFHPDMSNGMKFFYNLQPILLYALVEPPSDQMGGNLGFYNVLCQLEDRCRLICLFLGNLKYLLELFS